MIKSLKAPNIPSFFKTRRPRQFTYRPWFYNADKEARNQRNRILLAGMQADKIGGDDIKVRLHEKWQQNRLTSKQGKKSNFRLLVILIVLISISYYLLN